MTEAPRASAEDAAWMARAIEVARRAVGRVSPNPAVGAVFVRDGVVIAEGHTQAPGRDHAEIDALRKIEHRAEGATVYSTLEPCSHVGRTGPCAEALVRAGVARVVIGATDPNPRVNGNGIARLRAAGVEVVVGVLEAEAEALNVAFHFAMRHGRPWILAKLAASLDGRVATRTGESQWITGEEARAAGRALRAEVDAIVVGVGTVLADDPRLTARIEGRPDPRRWVVDSRLRTPATATLARTAREVPTTIATTRAALRGAPARARRLERAGVELLPLRATRGGQVDVPALVDALAAREIRSALVEGGPTLLGSFFDAGRVDHVVAYLAPTILGGVDARPAVLGRGVGPLSERWALGAVRHRLVGGDLEIRGDVIRAERAARPRRPRRGGA